MMTDHKITKKIYTIILTAVLVYGAFFSVVSEIAFAEELAKDAETKTEASTGSKESAQPSPTDSSSSKGDTSDTGSTAEKTNNAAEKNDVVKGDGDGVGNDAEIIPEDSNTSVQKKQSNDQIAVKPDAQNKDNDGEEPEAPPADGGQNGGSNSDTGGNNTGGSNNEGYADDHKILNEEEPTKEEIWVEPFVLNDTRSLVNDYTPIKDISGTVRYKDFFHIFDEGAYGTESMTIVISYKYMNWYYEQSFRIYHNHDGSWSGHIPWGIQIDKNDLIVRGWMMVPGTQIDIVDHSIISGIDSDPDGGYYEPEFESPTPSEAARVDRRNANDATAASDTEGSVSIVEPAFASESLINDPVEPETQIVNSVLSSYQNVSDLAVTDETNDGDSPINATTAMLAGVAAMFLITMALVIVPKV